MTDVLSKSEAHTLGTLTYATPDTNVQTWAPHRNPSLFKSLAHEVSLIG